jgi:membrane-associated phospholipid phosphatase
MFQTGPNLFLQALASDNLTAFMLQVSAMGYEPFLASVVAILLFGVSFTRGFTVLLCLLWSALVNSAVKDWVALPRPVHVDANVLNNGLPTDTPFKSMGATSFFGLIPAEVVHHVRSVTPAGADEFGFPSGHVQSTVVLWGAAGTLWSHRIVLGLAPAVVVLMALSRMYLGRHFLADVLGGAALGAVLLAALVLVRHASWDRLLFAPASAALRAALPNAAVWLFLVGAPLAVLPFYPERAGALLGIGAGFLVVLRSGIPADDGTRAQRAERVAIGLLIFVAARGVIGLIVGAAGLPGGSWWLVAAAKAVPSFLLIWGTVVACTRAGLYRPSPSTPARRAVRAARFSARR